jgi:hypothetical protein
MSQIQLSDDDRRRPMAMESRFPALLADRQTVWRRQALFTEIYRN